jgi:hypothetical protein
MPRLYDIRYNDVFNHFEICVEISSDEAKWEPAGTYWARHRIPYFDNGANSYTLTDHLMMEGWKPPGTEEDI